MPAPNLADALSSLARDWAAATRLAVTFEIEPPAAAVPEATASAIVLIVREALHNIAGHAQASSVRIAMSYQDGQLAVEIADDGRGFDPSLAVAGKGLADMRDRAARAGGELRIDAEPGNGTLLAVVVPLVPVVVADKVPKSRGPLPVAAAVAVIVGLIVTAVVIMRPVAGQPVLTQPSASTDLVSAAGGLKTVEAASPSASPSRKTVASPSPSRAVSSSQAPALAASCRVTYVKRSEWSSGFNADVTITNLTSAQISGWQLVWAFAGDQVVTNAWNTRVVQRGKSVTAEQVSNTEKIKPGESVDIGFQATYSGANAVPVSFTLNGNLCAQ